MNPLPDAFPAVTAKRTAIVAFGEPYQRGFAYDVVFGHEPEEARVGQVDGIVGHHPVIVFGEVAVLCGLTVDEKGIIPDFSLPVFVHHERVAQQGTVPGVYAQHFAFAGYNQRFQGTGRVGLVQRFYPRADVERLFQQIGFVAAEAAYVAHRVLTQYRTGLDVEQRQ